MAYRKNFTLPLPVAGLSLLALLLSLSACDKSSADKTAAAASQGTPVAAASAPAAASDAGTKAAERQAVTFAGKYAAIPAKLYIPAEKDWSGAKQAKDEPSKAVGDGEMTLKVDPEGRIAGTIDSGPASPAVVDGVFADGELRGTIRRKDPKDQGLTGVLVAKVEGDAAEGKLDLADATGALLREAKVTLRKK